MFSNIAQSSTEVMDVVKDCHQTFVVVFLRWCSGGVVFSWCFCGGVFVVVFSNIESSAEVMDVVKDWYQTFVVVFLRWCSGGVFVVFLWWCFCGGVFKHRPKFW